MKRHFNMAPLYSDRRIVERAMEMSDMHAAHAAIELGIGYRRLQRLIGAFNLEFAGRDRAIRPNKTIKNNADMLDAFMVAKIDTEKLKKCTKCLEVKKIDQFHKDKTKSTGLCSACKSCVSSRKTTLLGGDTN